MELGLDSDDDENEKENKGGDEQTKLEQQPVVK